MPKTVHVEFAGRNYAIKEKPMGLSGIWRGQLRKSKAMQIFESLDTAMIQLVAVADSASAVGPDGKPVGLGNVDLNQVVSIAKILPVIVNGLTNSIDEIEELLFAYSPELEADRDWLLENAYDTEAISAFCEVLKICFPITAALDLIRGPKAAQTPTSLRSQNGGSGQHTLAHRKKV